MFTVANVRRIVGDVSHEILTVDGIFDIGIDVQNVSFSTITRYPHRYAAISRAIGRSRIPLTQFSLMFVLVLPYCIDNPV